MVTRRGRCGGGVSCRGPGRRACLSDHRPWPPVHIVAWWIRSHPITSQSLPGRRIRAFDTLRGNTRGSSHVSPGHLEIRNAAGRGTEPRRRLRGRRPSLARLHGIKMRTPQFTWRRIRCSDIHCLPGRRPIAQLRNCVAAPSIGIPGTALRSHVLWFQKLLTLELPRNSGSGFHRSSRYIGEGEIDVAISQSAGWQPPAARWVRLGSD